MNCKNTWHAQRESTECVSVGMCMCVPAPWPLKGNGFNNTHGKHGAWRNAALTFQLSPSAGLPLAALGLKKQLVMRIAKRSVKKCNNRARFGMSVCVNVFSLFSLFPKAPQMRLIWPPCRDCSWGGAHKQLSDMFSFSCVHVKVNGQTPTSGPLEPLLKRKPLKNRPCGAQRGRGGWKLNFNSALYLSIKCSMLPGGLQNT